MPAQSATHVALQALLSIQSIPPKLVTQADSLLSLSRQRAANLKPEEEIARAHACAEIAAKRNRVSLRLPSVKSGAGAPAKPGVYKKLVVFLDGVLQDAGNATPTAGKKTSAVAGEGTPTSSAKRARAKDVGIPEMEGTPTKKRKMMDPTRFFGTVKNTARTNISMEKTAPDYTMPSIRKLCNKFNTPTLAPHVFTGVCIILKEAGLWPIEDGQDENEQIQLRCNVLALVIAMYLMVLTKMKKGKLTTGAYTTTSTQGIGVLDLQSENSAGASIQEWIGKINSEGWATDKDWWTSVPENVIDFPSKPGDSGVGRNEEASGEDGEIVPGTQIHENQRPLNQVVDFRQKLEEPDPEGVLLPGLGTMMQDAVDYLSEDRRADYAQWKAGIERRMKALDKRPSIKGKGIAV